MITPGGSTFDIKNIGMTFFTQKIGLLDVGCRIAVPQEPHFVISGVQSPFMFGLVHPPQEPLLLFSVFGLLLLRHVGNF